MEISDSERGLPPSLSPPASKSTTFIQNIILILTLWLRLLKIEKSSPCPEACVLLVERQAPPNYIRVTAPSLSG